MFQYLLSRSHLKKKTFILGKNAKLSKAREPLSLAYVSKGQHARFNLTEVEVLFLRSLDFNSSLFSMATTAKHGCDASRS